MTAIAWIAHHLHVTVGRSERIMMQDDVIVRDIKTKALPMLWHRLESVDGFEARCEDTAPSPYMSPAIYRPPELPNVRQSHLKLVLIGALAVDQRPSRCAGSGAPRRRGARCRDTASLSPAHVRPGHAAAYLIAAELAPCERRKPCLTLGPHWVLDVEICAPDWSRSARRLAEHWHASDHSFDRCGAAVCH